MNENRGGSLLVWLVTIVLMIFSASRSVHLIQTTLPRDGQVMAYAALAALDGGVLGWFFFVTRAAAPGNQRTVGYLLLIVDLLGVVSALLADTWLVAGEDAAMVGMVALWVLPLIIGANIIGAYVAHLLDPAQALRDAQRAVTHELEAQKAMHLRENAPSIAAGVAQAAAIHEAAQMTARFQAANTNGNHKVDLEAEGVPAPKVKRKR